MISFTCGSCGKVIEVHESMAGRQTPCPQCGIQQMAPQAAAQPGPTTPPPGQAPPQQQAPQQAPQQGPPPNWQAPPPASDQNVWRVLCHLSALAGFVTSGLGWVIGPLVIWLIKKDQDPWVNDQGKEAINFNISMLIYATAAALSIFVLIGIVLLPAVAIFQLVMTIIASVRAGNGQPYRYPLTIRFLK